MRVACVDLDDCWREDEILEYLVPLKEAIPQLALTLYTIPNKLGPVFDLAKRYPWITFAIHGWEHTFAECRGWHSEEAKAKIAHALAMGYAPLFKPPNWIYDVETEKACRDLDVLLHFHPNSPPQDTKILQSYSELHKSPEVDAIHTHLIRNPSTDHVTNHPGFRIETLSQYELFVNPAVAQLGPRESGDDRPRLH